MAPLLAHPMLATYVVVFSAAAVACLASAVRALSVDDDDTRRGLVAFLVTSGGWAAAHVGYLTVPTPELKYVFYTVGLLIGFSAVGPWLYFCSAYTGRSLHRNGTIRRIAVGTYLSVAAVKVTNPLHQMYFTTEYVTEPFPYLVVHSGIPHWLVMALSYALASVGYFMLFELFVQVGHDTRALAALIGVTGLPVFLDVAGFSTDWLVDITYEPIGVAAFAVGVLFLYIEQFQVVQFAGRHEDPVLVLTEDERLRDFNERVLALFPDLSRDDLGEPLSAVLPEVSDVLGAEEPIIDVVRNGETRYYRVTDTRFAAGQTSLGRVLLFDDVTDREEYRRRLERQNERLERFASVVSHDLRNPLTVAQGRLELAREECDSESLATVERSLDRMAALIEDLLTLARQGRDIDETVTVRLGDAAETAWGQIDAPDAVLEVAGDQTFEADPDRLQQLFENLFRNAVEHGGPDVTVRVGPLSGEPGFYVEDDGPGIPPEEREEVLESGFTTSEDGTGFGLAIVAEIARAHGWEIRVTESEWGGARFDVVGPGQPSSTSASVVR
ncbi:MAG: ATP-binding protein [Halobacteriaceae archaeon]